MDRMKIATIIICCLIVGWIGWIIKIDFNHNNDKEAPIESENDYITLEGKMRGIWLSYIDISPMLKGKDEDEFTKNIQEAFDNIRNFGFNTVFVQVRPFSDALYKSKYYPWSFLCSGVEGVDIDFDPLKIMVEEAHKRKMRIEAWLNPFRVRTEATGEMISDKNPAKNWLNENSDSVIRYNEGIYYNPGKEEVRELIINGIKEIVENYKVDGIHFDDYFYPGTESYIDEEAYGEYLLNGGSLSLEQWRRENINTLIREVYYTIKSVDTRILFGVSPQGSMNNNYNNQYIDVEEWVQNQGYIDYICPQIYYGFENENSDFLTTIRSFNDLVTEPRVKLYIGIAAYKVGLEDRWAGTGYQEWINNEDILKRQVEATRNLENCHGVILYRYNSLFNPDSQVSDKVNREIENLKQIF